MNVCSLSVLVLLILTIQLTHGRRNRSKPKNRDRDRTRTVMKNPEVDSMICPSCDKLFCTVKKASKLKCRGGKTTDVCGCCPVCAQQSGEPCGGEWNYLGKCDVGLYCKATTQSIITPASFYQQQNTEVSKWGMPEGKCFRIEDIQKDRPGSVSSTRTGTTKGRHPTATCEIKCSPDYCLRNPRAICSAVDVVDMKRDCQGTCQHTTCQACSWVDPDPDCGACASDDFSCMKKFAKCIKRNFCSRSKFPCKTIPGKNYKGKFQCMVPKCLDKS